MDQRLLAYYSRELQYLRELGGEFAKQFPKIAGRLGLDAFECADPYVERLLEGFAFLTARVQLKIDSEFPRFTEHLLELVYPHYLAPTPSMAVVELKPDPRQAVLTEGFPVPRGTTLRGNLPKGDQTPCEYRTAHDLTLWPLELTALSHSSYLGDIGAIRLSGRREPKGAVRLRLETLNGAPFHSLGVTRLPLFVRAPDQLAMRLYELLMAGTVGLVFKEPGGSWREIVPDRSLGTVGFEDDEALLPYGIKSFQGYRLLHEYFGHRARRPALPGLRARGRHPARSLRSDGGKRHRAEPPRPLLHAGHQSISQAHRSRSCR
jgi:type VI secretion system protein ImpG